MSKAKPPSYDAASPLKLSLALQGGGAHAAFAWGALDQLLLEDHLVIEGVSATSGGAVQAVVLAEGFRVGGCEGARYLLEKLWKKISIGMGGLPVRTNPFSKMLGEVGIDFSPQTMALDYITRLFSPYQFNLFDLNPLKTIVEELVDFDKLRKSSPFPLYINTTSVKTGQSHLFTGSELTLDVVMASCCLPFVFKTVTIDGEPYWDGAYSGNPPLTPLLSEDEARTIMLVQTVPMLSEEVPMQASDILDRATEVSFNTSLIYEMRAVEAHNAQYPNAKASIKLIEADEVISGLGRASKLNADSEFLDYLHDLGVQAVQDWLL